MEKQLDLLEKIQVIDLGLKQAKEFLDEFPKIMGELDAGRETEERKVAEEKARFEEMKKERKSKERELEDGEEHIKKSQGRLYAAKSNKEYDAMIVEIETRKRKNSQLEDDILILYDQLEELEDKIKDMEKSLKGLLGEHEREKKDLEDRRKVTEEKISVLQGDREKVKGLIRPDILAAYTRIQDRLGAPALARAVDETCCSCQYRIPPQTYNEVLKGSSVHTCPNCQRILVYRETEFLADREA